MLKTFTLKNGIKVATYSIPQMRSAYVSLAVKGGSIFDTRETSGRAHFMEHILVQAIPSFPNVEALSDYIESLAGSYNASTSPQSIDFSASIPSTHLESILKIGSEVFFEPLFAEADIERERGAILEEIRQKEDTHWFKNSMFWNSVRFLGDHPLKLSTGGSLEAVSKLNKKDLIDYWSTFFHPLNTQIVIVGNLDDSVKGLLDKYFLKYNSKQKFPGFPKLSNADFTKKGVALREDKEFKTCYLDLSFPSACMETPLRDRITQHVLSFILGGLRRSRLFRLLRQRRGLVYDVGFSQALYESFGYGDIYSQAEPQKLEEVLRLIAAEVSTFYKNGPTDEEVAFAKNYYKNRVLMYFDNPVGIANWIESDLMWEDKILLPEEYVGLIDKVTREGILEFMKKYFEFDKLNLTVQGPIEDSKSNREKFTKLIEDIK